MPEPNARKPRGRCTTNADLAKIAREINRQYFGDALPPAKIFGCDRLERNRNAMGEYSNGEIFVDNSVIPQDGWSDEEARFVIGHEVCHWKVDLERRASGRTERDHGEDWQECVDGLVARGATWMQGESARYSKGESRQPAAPPPRSFARFVPATAL